MHYLYFLYLIYNVNVVGLFPYENTIYVCSSLLGMKIAVTGINMILYICILQLCFLSIFWSIHLHLFLALTRPPVMLGRMYDWDALKTGNSSVNKTRNPG